VLSLLYTISVISSAWAKWVCSLYQSCSAPCKINSVEM
jgi:hypothetical protein